MYQYLSENNEIKTVFSGRIYPLIMPEKTEYPAIIYQHINTVFYRLLQKQSKYRKNTVQFTVYDKTFGKARKSARFLKQVLIDFTGDMCGTNIEAVHLISENPGKTDTEEYTYILEFEFDYNENEGEN